MKEQIEWWFTYHKPLDSEVTARHERLKAAGKQFALTIVELTPPGGDQNAAILLARQATMMASAAVACENRPGRKGGGQLTLLSPPPQVREIQDTEEE